MDEFSDSSYQLPEGQAAAWNAEGAMERQLQIPAG
jgi:hypothetical protein